MEDEVKILSKHNLDCSSLENLAKDIANRLQCNVEFGEYQKIDGLYKFVTNDTIQLSSDEVTITLIGLRNDEKTPYNFVIELGDEAKLMYEDFIELQPAWEERFANTLESFKNDQFASESFYTAIFEKLKKLGADKVYFIKDQVDQDLTIPKKETLDEYLRTIKQKTAFFEVMV